MEPAPLPWLMPHLKNLESSHGGSGSSSSGGWAFSLSSSSSFISSLTGMNRSLQSLAIGVETGAFHFEALKETAATAGASEGGAPVTADDDAKEASNEEHKNDIGGGIEAGSTLPSLPPSPGANSDASFDSPSLDSITPTKNSDADKEEEERHSLNTGRNEDYEGGDEDGNEEEQGEVPSIIAAEALRSAWLKRVEDAQAFNSMVRVREEDGKRKEANVCVYLSVAVVVLLLLFEVAVRY